MSDNNNDDEQIVFYKKPVLTVENNRIIKKEIEILKMYNPKTKAIRSLTPEEEEEALLQATQEAAVQKTTAEVKQAQAQASATAEMLPTPHNSQNQTNFSVPSPVQVQTPAKLNEAIFLSIEGNPYDPNSKKRYDRVVTSGATCIKRTSQGIITVTPLDDKKPSDDSNSN